MRPMTQHSDAEFEQITHSDETHIEQLESDDTQQPRADVKVSRSVDFNAAGELPDGLQG